MNESSWNILINVITLITIIVIWFYQREKIKSLQSALSSQKSVLDAVQAYFGIFKIDEVRKFVSLSEENYKREADKKIQETVAPMTEQMNKQREQTLKQLEMSGQALAQFFSFSFSLLLRLPPTQRFRLIDENLKEEATAAMMKTFIKDQDKVYLPPETSIAEFIGLANPSTKTEQ
jgi:flagellar motor component MotA